MLRVESMTMSPMLKVGGSMCVFLYARAEVSLACVMCLTSSWCMSERVSISSEASG